MSGYDYNIGYLPGAVEPPNRLKQLLKWSFMAIVIYFAVQMVKATLAVDQRETQTLSEQRFVSLDRDVSEVSTGLSSNLSGDINDVKNIINEPASRSVVNTQPVADSKIVISAQDKTLKITTSEDEAKLRSTDIASTAISSAVINASNEITTSSSDVNTQAVETIQQEADAFDEELANLINNIFTQ